MAGDQAQGDGEHDGGQQGGDETTRTVIVALGANLVIAVAKFVAGILGGSSAMLAEGAHSVADTLNEGFLLASLKRAQRAPDATHPFGYGAERFFWSLIAAVGIFVAGAGFSVFEGLSSLLSSREEGAFVLSYITLAVAFVAEGTSWLRAVRQVRAEAREYGRGTLEHIRRSTDPTVKTVASEDTAALIGLVLAAVGIALHQVTGSAVPDAVASLLIGALLVYVAYALGRDTKELLIGESAPLELRQGVVDRLREYDEISEVLDVVTLVLAPKQVLVAAHVDVRDELPGDVLEELSDRIDRDLQDRYPAISHVYIDLSDRDRFPATVDGDRGGIAR